MANGPRRRKPRGVIERVVPGGLADAAGLRPGDVVRAVNGNELSDVIDYKFQTTERRCRLLVERTRETFSVEVLKDLDDDLGIVFKDDLFDGIRRCRAGCIFCFVDQLPSGVRPSLKIKDDDYRLSFLHGDYISLSNLSDDDFARIAEQRLSPLYVSVHTTNPGLRRSMMRGPEVGEITEQLRRLTEARIEVHAQIVVCPGLNDGPELERTVLDLGPLHPGVRSVSVVPVGLTRHRKGLPAIPPVTPEMAREIVKDVHRWQRGFRGKLGTRFVFAADELYLAQGLRLPSAPAYEGFPQLDNGVGEARLLLQDLGRAQRRLRRGCGINLGGAIVTGEMCAPLIEPLVERINAAGGTIHVVAIQNRFLGPSVTTAGLLAGRDIIEQLRRRSPPARGPLYVSNRSLREGRFLDDVPVDEVERELKLEVVPLDAPGDIVHSKQDA